MLAKQLGRKAVVQTHGRNVVARLRPVVCRRPAAFKGARPSVRVFAAGAPAGDAPATIQLTDVKEGDEYEGTVKSVEEFGAFVSFGSTTDGLVHISKMGPGYVKAVKDVLSTGQKVTVRVLSVDAAKNRVSLELKGAVGAPAPADASPAVAKAADASAEDGEEVLELITDGEAEDTAAAAEEDDDDAEVELEEGQLEVYADLPGFEDIPFVMEEEDADELSEPALAALEADLDAAEIEYELEAPAYMEEVQGKVSRIEEYGIFLEFAWNGKTLTGLLPRDEMKVPSSALDPEAQEALRAEWADTEFEMPAYVDLPEEEIDPKKYYRPGDEVPAFVLESNLIGEKGISLTQFTDEDVAAEAVELFEEVEDDDDEELDRLIEEAAEELQDEVLAVSPEALLEAIVEEDDSAAASAAGAEGLGDYPGYDEEAVEAATGAHDVGIMRSGLIKGKNGLQVAPLGLPNRPVAEGLDAAALAVLGTTETDFDGDEVALVDYYDGELYDNIPRDILKRMGMKMTFNEAGEAEISEREGHEADADLPLFLFEGDMEARARALVADMLDDDEDEAELPARAARRPVPLR